MTDNNWQEAARERLVHQPVRLFLSLAAGGVGLAGGFVALFDAGVPVVVALGVGLVVGFREARHWALRETWRRREARLKSSTAALEVAQKEKDEQTRAFMRTLADVADRYATPFEEELTIAYYIGRQDRDDRVERYHKTHALGNGASERLLWRTFEESATGRNARYDSFEDIGLTVASDEEPYRVEFLPIEESAARLRGMLCFNPPLGEKPLAWTLGYYWPGMWRELRQNHRDTAFVIGSRGLQRLKVAFIFPSGTVNPRFTSKPPIGSVTQERRDGRFILIWRIENPDPIRYDFGIAVDGFGAVGG